MYKKILLSLYLSVITLIPVISIVAQIGSRGTYGDTPMEILQNVEDRADKYDQTQVLREPNLDNQSFGPDMKISNTLDSIRMMIGPYLQWMLYIGLAGGTLLIIRNGFLLTTSFGDEGKKKDIINKIKNIIIGILLITGFYFIIKLLLGLINFITSAQG